MLPRLGALKQLPVLTEALSVIALSALKKPCMFTGVSLWGSMCAPYLGEGFLSLKKVLVGSSRLSVETSLQWIRG